MVDFFNLYETLVVVRSLMCFEFLNLMDQAVILILITRAGMEVEIQYIGK